MILGFKTIIDNKPNNFVAKIWKSLLCGVQINAGDFVKYLKKLPEETRLMIDDVKPKRHTIRSGNRWRSGMFIDFYTGVRTKSMNCFAPRVKCQLVQQIKITYFQKFEEGVILTSWLSKWQMETLYVKVFVDGKVISEKKLEELAVSDGFDCKNSFFNYFSENFEGQIIHWTENLKY